jgi:hypothetical protein
MPDRPYRSLCGRTPLEAARTPTMDALAGEGQSGFYYPLGPGRIPSTELTHFRIFGYGGYSFPGRACLEALGHGVPCVPGDVFSFLAPRRVERGPDGAFYVVGGYGERPERASAVYSELDGWTDVASGYRFEVFPLEGDEAILRIRQGDAPEPPRGEVTDSDPFFFTDLPVLRPRPLASAGQPETAALTADALNRFLLETASMFDGGPSSTGPETFTGEQMGGHVRAPAAVREAGRNGGRGSRFERLVSWSSQAHRARVLPRAGRRPLREVGARARHAGSRRGGVRPRTHKGRGRGGALR